MTITLNGTSGITTPALTNSGALTQTGAATLSSTLQAATTIGVGGATPASSGAGITFPATQSASTDANTLDDYEEGTWTPSITLGSGSATFTTLVAKYVKIGRQVTLNLKFSVSSASSAANPLVSGLPFSLADSVADTSGIMREYALTGLFWGLSYGSGTQVSMQRYDNSNTMPNGSPAFSCTFTYQTT